MKYIGFYWTLPVFWAGFVDLPAEADAAAKKSKTICYQMERVRRWVQENTGHLIEEVVYLEASEDRGTVAVESALAPFKAQCQSGEIELLYVRFGQDHHWRRHRIMLHYLKSEGFKSVELSPEPLTIAGVLFDPGRHFKKWRETSKVERAKRKEQADEAIALAIQTTPVGPGRYKNYSGPTESRPSPRKR